MIERLKCAIAEADAIAIGAGAGLSTSAGFTYSGGRFEKYFSDFREKYGFAVRSSKSGNVTYSDQQSGTQSQRGFASLGTASHANDPEHLYLRKELFQQLHATMQWLMQSATGSL